MDSGMKAVKQYYEQVACPLLPGRRIGLLHGKMKPKDKDEVMQQFKACLLYTSGGIKHIKNAVQTNGFS